MKNKYIVKIQLLICEIILLLRMKYYGFYTKKIFNDIISKEYEYLGEGYYGYKIEIYFADNYYKITKEWWRNKWTGKEQMEYSIRKLNHYDNIQFQNKKYSHYKYMDLIKECFRIPLSIRLHEIDENKTEKELQKEKKARKKFFRKLKEVA